MIIDERLESFRAILGERGIIEDAADIEPWDHDSRGRKNDKKKSIFTPQSNDEVAAVVSLAARPERMQDASHCCGQRLLGALPKCGVLQIGRFLTGGYYPSSTDIDEIAIACETHVSPDFATRAGSFQVA